MTKEIVNFIVFVAGKNQYAFEIKKIQTIEKDIKVTPIPNTKDYLEGVTNLRGELITVVNLSKKLSLGERFTDIKDKELIILYNEDEKSEDKVGILIDKVEGVKNVSAENIKTNDVIKNKNKNEEEQDIKNIIQDIENQTNIFVLNEEKLKREI